MKKNLCLLAAAFFALSFSAFAQQSGLRVDDGSIVSKPSKYSVAETIDRVEKIAKEDGLVINARIDFAAIAKKAGVELRPSQLLILGREMGRNTSAMIAEAPLAAIDLPFKALAWEDAQGKIWLSYTNGSSLLKRWAIKSAAQNAANIDASFDRIMSAALQ